MNFEIKEIPVKPQHQITITLNPDDVETLKEIDFRLYNVRRHETGKEMADLVLTPKNPEQLELLYDILRDLYVAVNNIHDSNEEE